MSRKQDQLIRTGTELFFKHGLRRVSVEEICRRAEVSKPTFYKFFENKEALARKIVDLWLEEALGKIEGIEDSPEPFPDKMKRILALRKEIAGRPGPEFMEDLIRMNIDMGDVWKRVLHFLVQGQLKGNIRQDIRAEFLLAAFSILNTMHHDPKTRALYDNNVEALAEDIFKLFFYGALPTTRRDDGSPPEKSIAQEEMI
jgi:AcrR family transcriptional regulator